MQSQGTSTAYFSDLEDAEQAAVDLRGAGVPDSDIDLQHRSTSATRGRSFMENLKEFFSGEGEDDRYAGGAVLTIYGNREIAVPILRRYHARFEGAEAYDEQASTLEDSDSKRLRLREERLSVDKQNVKVGEVHLGKDVVEQEEVIDVPVTREQVRVTRTPVNEADYQADIGEIGDGEEVSVPVMRDEVNVKKHVVVTEEIGLEKSRVQDTERVAATVRKERARVDSDANVETVRDDAP